MDDMQIERLRDTLQNLVVIRTNMEQIVKDLSATQNEMQEKLLQAKRNDVVSAQQKLFSILKQQTCRMSQSLDQMQEDNKQLQGIVQVELGNLLQDSSKHMEQVHEFQNDLSSGTQDRQIVVAVQHNGIPMSPEPPADPTIVENNVSDANDENSGTSPSDFSID